MRLGRAVSAASQNLSGYRLAQDDTPHLLDGSQSQISTSSDWSIQVPVDPGFPEFVAGQETASATYALAVSSVEDHTNPNARHLIQSYPCLAEFSIPHPALFGPGWALRPFMEPSANTSMAYASLGCSNMLRATTPSSSWNPLTADMSQMNGMGAVIDQADIIEYRGQEWS